MPNATAMRTHALVQSSTIFATISEQFQQIETDVSLFLPFQDNLQPMDYYISEKGRRLTRIPYYWEDDVAAMWPEWKWDNSPPPSQGLRVFDFHPMYVGLNIQNDGALSRIESVVGDHTSLQSKPGEQCAPFINTGVGSRHFLEGMISPYRREQFQNDLVGCLANSAHESSRHRSNPAAFDGCAKACSSRSEHCDRHYLGGRGGLRR